MKVMKSVRNGISLVIENYKMVLVIYVVNLCTALLLAIPFYSSLKNEIAFKGVRDDLVSGFNLEWWRALQASPRGLLDTLRPTLDGGFTPLFDNFQVLLTGKFTSFGLLIFLMVLVYVVITAFFNGGILGLFADEKRSYTTGRFFSFSGFYFHHFMSLVTTVFILLLLFYKFLKPLVFNTVDGITQSWLNDPAVWWMNLAGFIVVALLLMLIRVIFDYAKIILVVENQNSSWYCIWLAVKFIFTHPLKTLGLYGILMAIGLGLMLVFGGLLGVMNPGSVYVLIVLVFFQQFFMFVKIGHRLLILGAQLALFQQRKPVVVTSKKKIKTKTK